LDEIIITVDPEIRRKFEELPGAQHRNPWTQEKEALLLQYWPVKNHGAVARLLGVKVNTALKRFRELSAVFPSASTGNQ